MVSPDGPKLIGGKTQPFKDDPELCRVFEVRFCSGMKLRGYPPATLARKLQDAVDFPAVCPFVQVVKQGAEFNLVNTCRIADAHESVPSG
jgi:hypothetical protein